MTLSINPTITVAGVDYSNFAFNYVTIDYGRNNIWDETRPSLARVEIINTDNSVFPFAVSDDVVIKLKNTANVDVTLFTGKLVDVKGSVRFVEASAGLGIISLTAVGAFTQMSRAVVSTTTYPAESDHDRITRILNESNTPIDVVDAATYYFAAHAASPTDAYSLCQYFANTVTGNMYETTLGTVGFAGVSRRRQDALNNGYLSINPSAINMTSINSSEAVADVMNLVNYEYTGGMISLQNTDSQSSYGVIGSSYKTEVDNLNNAEQIANNLIVLRAYPKKSINQFSVRLNDPNLTNAEVDDLLQTYFGMPIFIDGLPNSIISTDYYGFIEGWNFTITPTDALLTMKSSDAAYGYIPTRWSEVNAALQWQNVTPATMTWTDYAP